MFNRTHLKDRQGPRHGLAGNDMIRVAVNDYPLGDIRCTGMGSGKSKPKRAPPRNAACIGTRPVSETTRSPALSSIPSQRKSSMEILISYLSRVSFSWALRWPWVLGGTSLSLSSVVSVEHRR